jgi:hypothetical protein
VVLCPRITDSRRQRDVQICYCGSGSGCCARGAGCCHRRGSYDCGAFPVTYSGHDDGRVTDWFNAAGDPIKEIGHIQSWETDVNASTGRSIYVATDLMVHMDFVAGTVTITGKRNLSTVPGQGVVVQHVGRVVIGPDGPISLSGKYPEFETTYMSGDFCAALA